jgi:hypothetical protein
LAFSYNFGANPAIDYPRLLIADTVDTGHVFEDSEILAATAIETATFQSAQRYSGPAGSALPSSPVPYRRIAATLLDALASNKARIAAIKQVLDVKLDASDAAIQLRAAAQALRDADDNSGSFMVIEQVNNSFSFADRWWKQIQRQSA